MQGKEHVSVQVDRSTCSDRPCARLRRCFAGSGGVKVWGTVGLLFLDGGSYGLLDPGAADGGQEKWGERDEARNVR